MTTLAQKLRHGTQQSHTLAENTAYMKCFLKGIVEREPFRQLLANLYYVYSTLEGALRLNRDNAIISEIYFPELNRTDNLAEDLAYYYGPNWEREIQPTPCGKIYVDRLKALAKGDPKLLIAHCYTRYLGDLSGGQSLKNIIRSALQLPEGKGTAMYEFDSLPTPVARRQFKEMYRDALNSLPLDEATMDCIVEEANYAFALNRDVMHDLESLIRTAIGEHTFDLLTRQDRPGSTEAQSTAGHPVALMVGE
ncbi:MULTISPECIES: heme oxygenase (biliverdin-producing) [unclassified Synechocystis]|uniref:biliverdin-producing heme oxygenase n=1 Tax=unclassified Synechocystis TaxID=2640012 RepID=UPI0004289E57|nr:MULTISPECIES: heme oxygenase (biliverdin-producing) [unclassified Synechocystis]AIE73355.1 Heme oxygenase [Synechocystis sp. PCC 6714]MCT0253169.1 heme oxygenase (biliverdin-producing) [Synechocystis sp. CS-94]